MSLGISFFYFYTRQVLIKTIDIAGLESLYKQKQYGGEGGGKGSMLLIFFSILIKE